jgi:hypothetical protein
MPFGKRGKEGCTLPDAERLTEIIRDGLIIFALIYF